MPGLGRIHLVQTRDGARELTCERPLRANTNDAVNPDTSPLDRAPLQSSFNGAQRLVRQVHNGHARLPGGSQGSGMG